MFIFLNFPSCGGVHQLISFLLVLTLVQADKDFQNPNTNFETSKTVENIPGILSWEKLDPKLEEPSQLYPFRPAEPITPGEFHDSNFLSPAELERSGKISLSNLEHPDKVKQYETKNGLIDKDRRWPMGIIPYVISDQFDDKYRLLIARSFKEFHKYTCVRFVPRKAQKDYIYIYQGAGCDSDAGREGGEQTVSLGQDCDYISTIVHELNHAVGFWHEQNRYDRDSFIKIHWDNIFPENKFNFDKLKRTEITDFGIPYDTDSLMHYDQYAFSKDPGNLPVMTPFDNNPKMGLGNRFSKSDVQKINRMYDCNFLKPWMGKPAEFSTKVADSECHDFHSNCTNLVNEKLSCDLPWMTVNCRQSCGLCDHVCQDTNVECANWAKTGKCKTNYEYMDLYCTKSCDPKCTNVTS